VSGARFAHSIIARMLSPFVVRRADWTRDLEHLRHVREAVFVREQNVPLELEWDTQDEACVHVLAFDNEGAPIGTGRLLPDGHIGRMAVLRAWRRQGVGGALLTELTRVARERGFTEVILNAQVQAIAFYTRHGFVIEGAEFLEAGIPHQTMRRSLG
jgi:predicted GNAT family N-acyltransferase